jgi:hypothetical protein
MFSRYNPTHGQADIRYLREALGMPLDFMTEPGGGRRTARGQAASGSSGGTGTAGRRPLRRLRLSRYRASQDSSRHITT